MLLLTGHEPDSAWHAFVDAATTLAVDLGARKMIGLGAYPFAAPAHPAAAPVDDAPRRQSWPPSLPYGRNSVDVPAGVQAATRASLRRPRAAGRRPVGAGAALRRPASRTRRRRVALLDGLARRDRHPRRRPSSSARPRPATASSSTSWWPATPSTSRWCTSSKQAYDQEESRDAEPLGFGGDLPSGDELAAEVERFLRDQGR